MTKTEFNKSKAIPSISIESQLLIDRLQKCSVGETATYDELSTVIGRNVQREGRGPLTTAMNRLMRDDGRVFECVRGLGVKRLPDNEILDVGQCYIGRAHRAAMRGHQKILCIKSDGYDSLSNEDKIKYNTSRSMLGVLEHITKPSKVKAIEGRVADAQSQLPPAKMLELFK